MNISAKPSPGLLRNKAGFRLRLMSWYGKHSRDLPWRKTTVPYRIWVSEIMLQQTRVNAVLDHYRRFLKAFPTLGALAKSDEQDVLAQWSGLGYYRRARMMYRAAKEVVSAHRGRFPVTADELVKLPGIGRYTAAAVASIAFNERRAVVDGNVKRVVERILGCSLPEEQVWMFAQDVICAQRPGDFNQAMMELGAMVCTPRNPLCCECPVKKWCGTRGERPTGEKRTRQSASLHYLYSSSDQGVRLVRRSDKERLMAGMWELPAVNSAIGEPLLRLKHSITKTDYQVLVFAGRARSRVIPYSQLEKLPLTGLARKILKRMGAIANPL